MPACRPSVRTTLTNTQQLPQGEDHKAECLQDGFSDFLTKPVTPHSVRQALARYAASVEDGEEGEAQE